MAGRSFKDATEEEKLFYIILGQQLAQHRQRLGLSLKDVAHEIGVTFQQVQKYESGDNRMPVYLLHKMSIIYGVSFSDVVSGDVKDIIKRRTQTKKIMTNITTNIKELSLVLGIK